MTAPVFTTLGCRLNAYETEAMKALAEQAGVTRAHVVNTCAVTAEAVRKARQEIRRIANKMAQRQIKPADIIAWSLWRRAHQAVARDCHMKLKSQL